MSQVTGPATELFEKSRGRIFGLAYRMLGSRADAEDVVQESYVRWHQADVAAIRNPEAWLVTIATRLSIDRLRALKAERDAYTGPWLPEPLMSDTPPPPDRHAELASDLSIAFLTLLERLGPEERAAFLLHDVFDCGYPEIARILSKGEAACRQIVHRARTRVRTDEKRFEVTEAARANLLRKFVAAMTAKDEQALLELFAPDATWTADGGGQTVATTAPIVGASRIAKLMLGLQRRFEREQVDVQFITVNDETGLAIYMNGVLQSTIAILTDGDRILAGYVVVNPVKLGVKQRPH